MESKALQIQDREYLASKMSNRNVALTFLILNHSLCKLHHHQLFLSNCLCGLCSCVCTYWRARSVCCIINCIFLSTHAYKARQFKKKNVLHTHTKTILIRFQFTQLGNICLINWSSSPKQNGFHKYCMRPNITKNVLIICHVAVMQLLQEAHAQVCLIHQDTSIEMPAHSVI